MSKRTRRNHVPAFKAKVAFAALSGDPDFEYAMVDGTIIRVHQHGIGAKGRRRIRRSVVLAAV